MTASLIGGPHDGAHIKLLTKWPPERIFTERCPCGECVEYREEESQHFVAVYYLQSGRYHFLGYAECSPSAPTT